MRNFISVIKKFMVGSSLLGLATLAFSTTPAFGQGTSGDIVGTVKDASGAVVPNASVTVTNESTGVVVKATSNQSGIYHVSNLLGGNYDLVFAAPGFATYKLKALSVNDTKTSTVDATLTVSSSTSVEVEASAGVTLDTTTNNLTTTMSSQELAILPTATSGFGVLNASLLAPNVASPGGIGIGTGPSVGGQRPRNNNYTLEGIDDNDKSVTGPLIEVPNDAVAEFNLITSQFSPEFGHSSGGQFNTTVISGTNHFHGKLYEYFDNRNLNAESGTAGGKSSNTRYDFNRYGGQVGGPIFHDKLFFFSNYERTTTGQSQNYFLCTPTAAGIATLKGLTNYGFRADNLNTYLSLTPAATVNGGGQIDYNTDQACFDQGPSAANGDNPLQYLTVTDANGVGPNVQIPLGNAHMTPPNFTNTDQTTSSIDYTLSPKDSFRFRYIYFTEGSKDTVASIPIFDGSLPLKQHLLAFTYFHNFTPNLINEFRIGFNRQYQDFPIAGPSFPGLNAFPNITLFDADIDIGPDDNAPQGSIQNLYQLVDNVSYVKGRHSLKFGFDGRKYISPQNFVQRQRGDYEYAALNSYLQDLAPDEFGERSAGASNYYGDQTAFYGYGNDTWRVTDKLTVNYGLRYEFTSVPFGQRQQAQNNLASVAGVITFNAPQPQRTNFAPRVGIAYAADDKTSIRAGFGMAYDVLFDNLGLLSLPPQFSQTNDVGTPGQPAPGDPNFLANGGLPSTLTPITSPAVARSKTGAYIPNQVLPYSENYNLTIQRVFAKNYTAEIQYLGTHGVHLPVQAQINKQPKVTAANQLPTYASGITIQTDGTTGVQYGVADGSTAPTLSSITALSNILPAFATAGFNGNITSYQPYGGSNYNGLGLNVTRRFINGFQLNASYTYSRAMDDSTAEVAASDLTQRRAENSQNIHQEYSRSALDRTHRVTLEAVYDVPYFKHSGFLLKNLAGNWQISPIYTYESPEYVTPSSEVNSNLNGDAGTISRTIYNANAPKGSSSNVFPVFNTASAATGDCISDISSDGLADAATPDCSPFIVGYVQEKANAQYVTAGPGTLPTAERNTLAGRPINNLTMAAGKRISFTERYAFEFQAQAFNLLNHAQYVPGGIDGIGGTSTFGAATNYLDPGSPIFNQPQKLWTNHARSLQLAAKFSF